MKFTIILASLVAAITAMPAVDPTSVKASDKIPAPPVEASGQYNMVCHGNVSAWECSIRYGAQCWGSGEFFCPRSPDRLTCTSSVCHCY